MPDELERNLPIKIPTYRIADEVRNEIARAMAFWSQYGPDKSDVLISRVLDNLSTPDGISTAISPNIIVANVPILTQSASAIDKLKNGVQAFRSYLESKTSADTKLIADMLSTFEIAIESVIKEL